MYSLCLSAGIRFLQRPVPSEELALPYGWVTDNSDLIGVPLFRISEMQQGREPTLRRGLWYAHESCKIPSFMCGPVRRINHLTWRSTFTTRQP